MGEEFILEIKANNALHTAALRLDERRPKLVQSKPIRFEFLPQHRGQGGALRTEQLEKNMAF